MKITKEYISENLLTPKSHLKRNAAKLVEKTNEELYLIFNDITSVPQCYCGCNIEFRSFGQGYGTYCSYECMYKSKERIKLQKKTNLSKYGYENISQVEIIKEKKVISSLIKYGTAHPTQTKEVQNKKKTTNLKKYGVEHVLQIKQIKEKAEQTNLSRLGVKHALQSTLIKNKIKDTNLLKYGVESTNSLSATKLKKKKGFLDNYGVENPSQLKSVKQKKANTCFSNYGVNHPSQSILLKAKLREKKELNGVWIKLVDKEDYELYCYMVDKHTSQQPLNRLINSERRGRTDLKENAFHLDHKYSKREGFLNNVPPFIVGSIHNLEFISATENTQKQSNCSIDINTLLHLIFPNR